MSTPMSTNVWTLGENCVFGLLFRKVKPNTWIDLFPTFLQRDKCGKQILTFAN